MNPIWLFFSFSGRIGRDLFWAALLVQLLLTVMMELVVEFFLDDLGPVLLIGLLLAALALVWSMLAIQVKRWHDIDCSAWCLAINFLPGIGTAVTWIVNGLWKGTPGANRFGYPPNH